MFIYILNVLNTNQLLSKSLTRASSSSIHRLIWLQICRHFSNLLPQVDSISETIVNCVKGLLLSFMKGLVSCSCFFSFIDSQVFLLDKELSLSFDHAFIFSLSSLPVVLVYCKTNCFKLLLLEENVQNLVIFHIESGLCSVTQHIHLRVEFFIRCK